MPALAHKQDVPVEHAGLSHDELMRIAFPGEQYARIFPVEAAARRERINAAAKRIAKQGARHVG